MCSFSLDVDGCFLTVGGEGGAAIYDSRCVLVCGRISDHLRADGCGSGEGEANVPTKTIEEGRGVVMNMVTCSDSCVAVFDIGGRVGVVADCLGSGDFIRTIPTTIS